MTTHLQFAEEFYRLFGRDFSLNYVVKVRKKVAGAADSLTTLIAGGGAQETIELAIHFDPVNDDSIDSLRDILARALNVTTSKVSIGTPQGHEPTQEINTLHNILPITLSAADADVAFKLLDSAALYAATKTEIFERLETGIRRVVDGLKAEQQSSITEKQIADLLKWPN